MRIVAVDDLKPGMILGKTILGNQGQILLRQGVTLTEGYIEHLKKYAIVAVYISTGRGVVVEDVISDETRIKALQGTREVLTQVKRGAPLEVEKVNQVLVEVIDELLLQDDIIINLVDLRSFSEDLFSHSVNVSILAAIIGIELRYDRSQLKDLALAALLHDIGLLFAADQDITDHPRLGSDYLQDSGRVSPSIGETVLQHHERWDGNGYPRKLKENQIHERARVISVANVFDRLSANNRYPMEEVIEYLMAKSGSEFEPRIVRKFLDCVSFYPVGTVVELNTGERGVVVQSNKGFPTRPVVRIEKNMYGEEVSPGYNIDLVEKMTYFVRKKLDENLV
ncbi:MAG TPA: HD domain-containing protein [Corynebacteriales bacterium]|nr:HD domain-containing protein [Bacillota bacterium]HHY08596.1 HD domain-containing protein [Mycobacteriales bacterium]